MNHSKDWLSDENIFINWKRKKDPSFLNYQIHIYIFLLHFILKLFNDAILTENKTILLSIVLYGCEIWSLILREEHRLRVFENGAEENIWP